MSDELKPLTVDEVLELAHGTYSMRDDLANQFLVLQEKLTQRQPEAKAQTKVDTSGVARAILPSDYALAEKLAEMYRDYHDWRDENAMRIAIYREEHASLPPDQSARIAELESDRDAWKQLATINGEAMFNLCDERDALVAALEPFAQMKRKSDFPALNTAIGNAQAVIARIKAGQPEKE